MICPLRKDAALGNGPDSLCFQDCCAWWIKYKEPIKERDNITGECGIAIFARSANFIAEVINKLTTSKGIVLPR